MSGEKGQALQGFVAGEGADCALSGMGASGSEHGRQLGFKGSSGCCVAGGCLGAGGDTAQMPAAESRGCGNSRGNRDGASGWGSRSGDGENTWSRSRCVL